MQSYRFTPKIKGVVQELIEDLLEKGFVTPSRAPCRSPIVLVKMKDDTYRMCVDYRRLNEVTVKDPFLLPHIETLLTKIDDAQISSMLDLHRAHHQIPMRKEDQQKTAFVTPTGKKEYTVMPFGLVNAPSTFARYMADLFRDLKFVCVYLEDILIVSRSRQEHWKHLDEV
ncbi:LAFA_0E20032g1_1 [Lachancea sp. 'fantastica']|nr:LAFA_0E20032g1_1 [Lachancea sp. 'fantastica']